MFMQRIDIVIIGAHIAGMRFDRLGHHQRRRSIFIFVIVRSVHWMVV